VRKTKTLSLPQHDETRASLRRGFFFALRKARSVARFCFAAWARFQRWVPRSDKYHTETRRSRRSFWNLPHNCGVLLLAPGDCQRRKGDDRVSDTHASQHGDIYHNGSSRFGRNADSAATADLGRASLMRRSQQVAHFAVTSPPVLSNWYFCLRLSKKCNLRSG
jgi:hypothetical protein